MRQNVCVNMIGRVIIHQFILYTSLNRHEIRINTQNKNICVSVFCRVVVGLLLFVFVFLFSFPLSKCLDHWNCVDFFVEEVLVYIDRFYRQQAHVNLLHNRNFIWNILFLVLFIFFLFFVLFVSGYLENNSRGCISDQIN